MSKLASFAAIAFIFLSLSANAGSHGVHRYRCSVTSASSDDADSPQIKSLISAASAWLLIGHSRANAQMFDSAGNAIAFSLNDDGSVNPATIFQISGGEGNPAPDEVSYGNPDIVIVEHASETNFFNLNADKNVLIGASPIHARINTVRNTAINMSCVNR